MKAQGQTPPRDVFIETEGHEKGVISSGKHVYGKGYDTLQLEEHRCGRCRFCTAEDCGACYSCRLQKPNQPKRSCIRKVRRQTSLNGPQLKSLSHFAACRCAT